MVNILRNRNDEVIVQTSFCLQIVIVVIHTMVSGNIDHQLYHREITVNTREDATEITIPGFNTNLIFLQCGSHNWLYQWLSIIYLYTSYLYILWSRGPVMAASTV